MEYQGVSSFPKKFEFASSFPKKLEFASLCSVICLQAVYQLSGPEC